VAASPTSLAYERTNDGNGYKAGLGWQWNFTARLEAEQAVVRAEAEAAVAQAWQVYVVAVAAYLDLLDTPSSTWTLQP
jgi:hypothetical protein